MVELDEATRRALLAREGPPASARAEILASLRTRLGGPEGPDDPGDPDPGDLGGGESIPFDGGAAGGQIAWAAKVVGATLGLAAAGVLTIKLGAVVMSSTPSEPAPTRTSEQPAEVAAVVEPHDTLVEAALPEPPSAMPIDAAPPHEPAFARASPSKTESTLAAELALLRAAKQLRDGDPEAALARLDLHRKQFPAGSLAPEREAIRVELLCALGRTDAAARARASFLEHHDDSPLRARVLASCGTDPASGGD